MLHVGDFIELNVFYWEDVLLIIQMIEATVSYQEVPPLLTQLSAPKWPS